MSIFAQTFTSKMLWLLIPLVTLVVYYVFFKKTKVPAGGPQSVTNNSKPKKIFSETASKLRHSLNLDEINKPICISLRKDEIRSSSQALLSILQGLSELADIYLVFQASVDDHEKEILAEIQSFHSDFPVHRCLFYSTDVGKVAIVRQVIPSLLIEHDRSFCEKLKPHVRRIIWVDSSAASSHDTASHSRAGLAGSTVPLNDKCSPTEGSSSSSVTQSASGGAGIPTVKSLAEVLHISLL